MYPVQVIPRRPLQPAAAAAAVLRELYREVLRCPASMLPETVEPDPSASEDETRQVEQGRRRTQGQESRALADLSRKRHVSKNGRKSTAEATTDWLN